MRNDSSSFDRSRGETADVQSYEEPEWVDEYDFDREWQEALEFAKNRALQQEDVKRISCL